MAKDLIVVFLALEMLSIPLYVLVGFARPRADSEESALKYFLLGAFSSAFQVYGIALIYGATQATGFAAIRAAIASSGASPLLLVGIGLMLVGLSFKVAAVPFHMWTPDVYEGAPAVVTAFMSVGAKAAGFAALVRVFFYTFHLLTSDWAPLMVLFAVLSTIVGNVAAISQTSIKRMLAYSSIAHAGYVFVAVLPGGQGALSDFSASAAIFYLAAYAITNVGAWAIVMAVETGEGTGSEISDYAGLARTHPGLAAAMALFMLSLTGLPPTIGFVAKFYVFRAALAAGYTWLVLVGVVTVLISAYYYLRVIVVMWMKAGAGHAVTPRPLNFTVGLTAAATLVLGLMPGPVMALVENSVRGLF
jgi:NADH-quinone oxidoreductase subunit N